MDALHIGVLTVASFVAGALNAVAGGGSFVTLPALLWAGVNPIHASATSSFALWPGGFASAVAYRRVMSRDRGLLLPLLAVSLVGGVLGALLLVKTPSETFLRLLPFLMLGATLVFTLGPRLTKSHSSSGTPHRWMAVLLQLPIAAYGGYFGGGMGFMMLAAYALTLPALDVHAHNGLKSLLAVVLNAAAILAFILAGVIAWREGLCMTVGAVLGGYLGSSMAQRVAASRVRVAVAVLGWALTLVFFGRAFLQNPR